MDHQTERNLRIKNGIMLIAQAKQEENIVEYILYMFQLHDMLRGLNFEENAIGKNSRAQWPHLKTRKNKL